MTTSGTKRQPIPFGKYLLLDRINIGGMAEVWRGKAFEAGGVERMVAIKRILPSIAEDEEFIRMFIDEAKITVQLTHANVGQIYELGHIASSYFIAMEYIAGKDLRQLFDRSRKRGERLPVPLACHVIAQVCEGLDYAHHRKDTYGREMNIVHRDVSPQNVLLGYDGEVKVIDFGIAKAAGKATKTQAGILKGKFAYMSPEQIRGQTLDGRSDQFAVGVCLYEMLTGERLFVGDSDFAVLDKVRKAEVGAPSALNPAVPPELDQVVLRALAREPGDRFPRARELGEALLRFSRGEDGKPFGRMDLVAYLQSAFTEDVERERQRMQEYAAIGPPDQTLPPVEDPVDNVHSDTAEMEAFAATRLGQAPSPPVLEPSPPASGADLDTGELPATSIGRPSGSSGRIQKVAAAGVLLGGGKSQVARPSPVEIPVLTETPWPASPAAAPANTWQDDLDETPNDGFPAVMNDSMEAESTPSSSTIPALEAAEEAPPESSELAAPPLYEAPQVEPTHAENPWQGAWRRPWMVGAAAGGLLLLGVAAALLRSPAEGLLLLDVPKDVYGKARVNINGEELKSADGRPLPPSEWPLLRRVPAGKATVLISAPGYRPYHQTLDISEGQEATDLRAKLERDGKALVLVVNSQPADAEVRVDGEVVKPQGEAEPYEGELLVGKEHVIEVRAPGHALYRRTVRGRVRGDALRLSPKLEPLEYQVVISSVPAGAQIFVDGRAMGQTPNNLKVLGGSSELVLRKRCYEPETLTLELPDEPREVITLTASLRRQSTCSERSP